MQPAPVQSALLDYAPPPTDRLRRFLRPVPRILAFMLCGAVACGAIGRLLCPPIEYFEMGFVQVPFVKATLITPPSVQQAIAAQFFTDVRDTLAILRQSDITDLTLKRCRPGASSRISNAAQLRDRLEIRYRPRSELILITVRDTDRVTADALIGEYASIAEDRIEEAGLSNVSVVGSGGAADRPPIDQRKAYTAVGACTGALVGLTILFFRDRRRTFSR